MAGYGSVTHTEVDIEALVAALAAIIRLRADVPRRPMDLARLTADHLAVGVANKAVTTTMSVGVTSANWMRSPDDLTRAAEAAEAAVAAYATLARRLRERIQPLDGRIRVAVQTIIGAHDDPVDRFGALMRLVEDEILALGGDPRTPGGSDVWWPVTQAIGYPVSLCTD